MQEFRKFRCAWHYASACRGAWVGQAARCRFAVAGSPGSGVAERCRWPAGGLRHSPRPVCAQSMSCTFDGGVLQTVEVAQHVAPLGPQARLAAALVQLLAQDEGEEGAEHVTPDGRV